MARKQRQPAKTTARSSAATAPQPRMLYLIKQVQYKTYVRLEAALQPLGVTAAQFRILATLSHGEKRSSAELSRMFGVKPQTMIKQIAILENNGMIERNLAKGNKRVLEVALTESGRNKVDPIMQHFAPTRHGSESESNRASHPLTLRFVFSI